MADVAAVKGSLGSVEFRLAAWLDPSERYQRRYVPVSITPGADSDEPAGSAEPGVRLWSIRSWRGGEGEDLWSGEVAGYRQSDGLRPVTLGDGLILARKAETTQDSTGAADLNDGVRLGFARSSLWTVEDATGYEWDRTNKRWKAGETTGAGTSKATSLAGGSVYCYTGHEDKKIYRWNAGGSAVWYNTGGADDFAYAPLLAQFGTTLYALDGDDLYEIDKSAADTRTIRADVAGSSDTYLNTTPYSYNRLAVGDVGPIWIQRMDFGQTYIWQYDEEQAVQKRIGKLPVDFAFPYSIFQAFGFTFVGFRYANSHTEDGDAYLYFFRGAQKGTAGPFRASGSTASKPVLIAGVIGDDLIVLFDGKVWAYNVSDGGISMVASQLSATQPAAAITFGREIFAGIGSTPPTVERYLPDQYVTSGTLDTGRHDFEHPGLRKLLLEVGVVTDPLPAGAGVSMEVSVDGGSPVALAGTHNTAGDRRFVWPAPAGSVLSGYQFELRPTGTGDGSVTPTIRDLFAAASGDAHRIEWRLAVDVADMSAAEIDALNGLVGGGFVTFTDPWQNRETDAADSFVVQVMEVSTPEYQESATPDMVWAFVRLMSRDLVLSMS